MGVEIALTAFGIILAAELPDKTFFASLILTTRIRPRWLMVGALGAFGSQVIISVLAGRLLTLAPHQVVEFVVAALFALGGGYLLLSRGPKPEGDENPARAVPTPLSPLNATVTAFGVLFAGEWGDITQIATANLAAHYNNPIAVGIGSLAGLMAATALATLAGQTVLRRIPLAVVQRVAGGAMLALAVFSLFQALSS
jgi:putative Ca2+/H+ antiporter (TMEM165/GDT1 family)